MDLQSGIKEINRALNLTLMDKMNAVRHVRVRLEIRSVSAILLKCGNCQRAIL